MGEDIAPDPSRCADARRSAVFLFASLADDRRAAARGRPAPADVSPAVRSQAAKRLKALGHEDRLLLLELLAAGPASVSGLARRSGLDPDLAGKHLRALASVGVVVRHQQGTQAIYRVAHELTARQLGATYRQILDDARRLHALVDLACGTQAAPTAPLARRRQAPGDE